MTVWQQFLVTLGAGGALGLLWNISNRLDEISRLLRAQELRSIDEEDD